MTDAETPRDLVLVNRYGATPEQVWAGVITDEHLQALKAGTEMFFTRLGKFLAR
jgi:hypothetical protein